MGVHLTSEDLRALADPIVSVVQAAFEDGLVRLPAVRKAAGVEPDPWWDAHTIRHIAFTRISGAEKLIDRRKALWTLDHTVPNSGIHLVVPGANVRVCRGTPELVPPPGRNPTRRDFWSQRQESLVQLSFWSRDVGRPVEHRGGPLNVLLLWHELTEDEISLAIAVPAGCWTFGGTTKLQALVPLDTQTLAAGEFVGDDDDGSDLIARIDEERDERGFGPSDR